MEKVFTDKELLYSATSRCQCGSGLAYPLEHKAAMELSAWVCAAVLKGEAAKGTKHDQYPWAFYKVREETSVNGSAGGTTRPPNTIARTVGKATCPKCQATWESQPYDAAAQGHHWRPGPCPGCGYTVGAGASWSSNDGPAIDTRFRDVVFEVPEAKS